MKYLSVCSGIEAATVAWHPLGWQPVAFSEIEPFPSAVLAHHYPTVPNLGDMTRFEEWPVELLADADILVGGSPCQAFSVAGKRESLADARGNLTLVYTKLLEAIDEQRSRAGRPPAICIWENVPGVLSTKDNAFGCFLAGLVGEEVPLQAPRGKWKDAGVVVGPERLAAWRILDAQFFGVAQRRRRVFLVSVSLRHPRAWACATAVLPLIESVRRDTPPSRETRQGAAASVAQCFAGSRQSDVAATQDQFVAQPVAFHNRQDPDVSGDITHPLGAKDNGMAVAQPVYGTDCYNGAITGDVAATLGTPGSSVNASGPTVMQPVGIFQDSEFGVQQYDSAGTLRAGRIPEHQMVMQPFCHRCQEQHFINGVCAYCDSSEFVSHPPPIAFKPGQSAAARSLGAQVNIACTLEGGGGGNNKQAIAQPVATVMQVRRLTPVECERLQGFPDNYTNIPWRKKPEAPDGPRYKSLGNSMAVPCMAWIGKRIAEVDRGD